MRKNVRKAAGAALVTASLAAYTAAGAFAYTSNTLKVTNHVATGDVDISIREEEAAADGKLQDFTQRQTVVPGDTISKIVTIDNLATESYIRCKVSFDQPQTEEEHNYTRELPEGSYLVGTDIPEGTYTFAETDKVAEFMVYDSGWNFSDVAEKVKALTGQLDEETAVKAEELAEHLTESSDYSFYTKLMDILSEKYPDLAETLNEAVIASWAVNESYDTSETVTLNEGQTVIVPSGSTITLKGTEPVVSFTEDDLNGISEDWVRAADGYYYYKNPVKTGESAELFDSVTIPESWDNDMTEKDLGITVTADAVQTRNFMPDWTADSPWFGLEIEECVHVNDGSYAEGTDTTSQTESIVSLDAGSARLVSNAADFMSGFGTLLPGDTYTDILKVTNSYDHDAEIFFHTETPENLTDEQKDLLKQLTLTITRDGKQIYSGDLESTGLNSRISLGTFKKGESAEIGYSVTMPPELQNAYAVRDTSITWCFDTGWIDDTSEAKKTGSSSSSSSGSSGSYSSPKTGINDTMIPVLFAGASALLVSGVLLLKKDKKKTAGN